MSTASPTGRRTRGWDASSSRPPPARTAETLLATERARRRAGGRGRRAQRARRAARPPAALPRSPSRAARGRADGRQDGATRAARRWSTSREVLLIGARAAHRARRLLGPRRRPRRRCAGASPTCSTACGSGARRDRPRHAGAGARRGARDRVAQPAVSAPRDARGCGAPPPAAPDRQPRGRPHARPPRGGGTATPAPDWSTQAKAEATAKATRRRLRTDLIAHMQAHASQSVRNTAELFTGNPPMLTLDATTKRSDSAGQGRGRPFVRSTGRCTTRSSGA